MKKVSFKLSFNKWENIVNSNGVFFDSMKIKIDILLLFFDCVIWILIII